MKKTFRLLAIAGLVIFGFSLQKSYSQTETPAKNWDTGTCFKFDEDGKVIVWAACSIPQVDGPCDRFKSCY